MVYGICRLCDTPLIATTRASLDRQFSRHNEHKHKAELEQGQVLIMTIKGGGDNDKARA